MKVLSHMHVYPQEYVRSRMLQFAPALASRLFPAIPPPLVRSAAMDALHALPPPSYMGGAPAPRELVLVFRHDCA
jgi:hypothetical protein